MQSLHSNRRLLALVQGALLVIAFVALSGVIGAQRAAPATLPRVSNLDVHVNLDGFTGADGLRVGTAKGVTNLPSPATAFDALNRRAGGVLQVTWDPQYSIPRFLTGNSRTAVIPYTASASERGNPLAIARGFLDENRALFRLSSVAGDFGTGRIEPDAQLGYSHIRMPQVYKGIPVFGRQLIVHVDDHEQIVAVNGQYVPGLNVATTPSLSKADAEQLAVEDIKDTQLERAEAAHVTTSVLSNKTALEVYVDDKGKATLTWSVHILTSSPLGSWTVFVNARRPAIVHSIDSAEGAKVRETYTARNGTDIPGRLLIQEGERSSDPVAQAAHDGAGKVWDYYFNTFKRDAYDGRGSPMISTVHYGSSSEDAENAAWIGEAAQMIYGDGGQIFKPLPYGLDVVGHEFTHGVVESTANLVYEGQSGALNESYADIFGAMIDRGNWTIGEQVVKSPPFPLPYLRSLSDPEAQGHYDPSDPLAGVGQPGSMNDYADLPNSRRADNGGVHINSGVPSHAAYFVAQALGSDKMEQIYYRALTNYLSPTSDFFDAGNATLRAATELYGQQGADAVRSAFNQVAINLSGSDNVPTPPTTSGTPGPAGTPSPGPTTQPAPEQLPEGCRDVIEDGGFEGTGGWNEVSSRNTQIIDTQLPHTGSQSAWLGGTDKESVQYIYQDVTIPANATNVTLSYFRYMHEEFSGLSGIFATDANFSILLADVDGNEIQTLEDLSSSTADDKWNQAQFDLSQFAGKTVRVVFTASNPRGNVSSLFIDDVAFAVCTTGNGPAAPPTSSADQIYLEGHITDADTRRGVEGAQIFILTAGLSATDAANDSTVTDDEVAAEGITDADGYYQTTTPVKRDETYSVIVVANGYRPIIADDGITLAADDPNPTTVDATVRRGR